MLRKGRSGLENAEKGGYIIVNGRSFIPTRLNVTQGAVFINCAAF